MGATGSRIPSLGSVGAGIPILIGPASLIYDTTDANANHTMLSMPAAGAVNVPVFAAGIGITGVDLALFNGIVQPSVAVVDSDRDSAVRLSFIADDRPSIEFNGSAGALEVVRAGLPLIVQNSVDAVANQAMVARGPSRATPAVGDQVYLSFEQDTDDGMTETVRLTSHLLSPAAGTSDARFEIAVLSADALVTMLQIDSSLAGVITTTIPAGDIILNDNVSILFGTAGAESDLQSNGTDTIWAAISGKIQINGVAGSEVVFNDGPVDTDLRVESVNNTNMLFVDASLDAVGIGAVASAQAIVNVRKAFSDISNNRQGLIMQLDLNSGTNTGFNMVSMLASSEFLATHTANLTDTVGLRAIQTRHTANAAATGTVTGVTGIYHTDFNINGGAFEITNQYGTYIEALTTGTNNYGIYINTPTGTIADAIHVVGGRTFLGGTLEADGALLMTGIVGVDYNPGSDVDTDIATIGVTDTPRFYWDESQDNFSMTKGLAFGVREQIKSVTNGVLNIEHAAAALGIQIRVSALDGDGTDDVMAQFYGIGNAAAVTNRERLEVGYVATGAKMVINSSASGTGTARGLEIQDNGTPWLTLAAGGDILIGADVFLRHDVNAGLTASTTQTQGQGPLTTEVNEVATVANANDTVTLPIAVAGRVVTIINNGANTLQIFPASGDNLGAGVDIATTLAAGSNIVFAAYDATNWETI